MLPTEELFLFSFPVRLLTSGTVKYNPPCNRARLDTRRDNSKFTSFSLPGSSKEISRRRWGYFQWQEETPQEAANYENQFHFPMKKFHVQSQTLELRTGRKENGGTEKGNATRW